MLKFFADECISPSTVSFLIKQGYKAEHVEDAKMSSAKDAEILDYTAKNDMVLITQDLDFSALLALSGNSHPGVITIRLKFPSPENVNNSLKKLLDLQTEEQIQGSIIILEETKIRFRRIPILPEEND
jgi:predicted nuclease of predicted toxin-antitoxin system